MREIEFKGKRIDTGEWIEGCYAEFINHLDGDSKPGIQIVETVPNNFNRMTPVFKTELIEVDLATVGQYTGRKDSDDAEIYDGTIIAFDFVGFDGDFYNERRIGLVRYSNEFCAFVISDNLVDDFFGSDLIYFGDAFRASGEVEVLGNRWDNPELLETK